MHDHRQLGLVDQTTGTDIQGRSPEEVDLEVVRSMPDRLTDHQMETLERIASRSVPTLTKTDDDHLATHLQILDANLPRRKEDRGNGELKAEAQFSVLRDMPRMQIEWMVGEALVRLNWFPTIKQIIDLCDEWTSPLGRPGKIADHRLERERTLRVEDMKRRLEREVVPQEEIDSWPEWLCRPMLRPYGQLNRCAECGSYAQRKREALDYQAFCEDFDKQHPEAA